MSLQIAFLGVIKSFLFQKAGSSPSEGVIKVNSSFHLLLGELELSDASHSILSSYSVQDWLLSEGIQQVLSSPPLLPVFLPLSACFLCEASFQMSIQLLILHLRQQDWLPCPRVPWHWSHGHLYSCFFRLRAKGKNSWGGCFRAWAGCSFRSVLPYRALGAFFVSESQQCFRCMSESWVLLAEKGAFPGFTSLGI